MVGADVCNVVGESVGAGVGRDVSGLSETAAEVGKKVPRSRGGTDAESCGDVEGIGGCVDVSMSRNGSSSKMAKSIFVSRSIKF